MAWRARDPWNGFGIGSEGPTDAAIRAGLEWSRAQAAMACPGVTRVTDSIVTFPV
jgi:hypothetical protein